MRSENRFGRWFLAVGLSTAVAACSGGTDKVAALRSAGGAMSAASQMGPSGDYPVVLGDPYTIDGKLYTPVDTLSYDEVGYAAMDPSAGPGVTIAHKTLPLPSYVEVTSLDSGKTILARVERRGPQTNDRIVALSPDAQAQLGIADGTPVRVRRVNPPEVERAELRRRERAPQPMDTPKSLVEVLRRNLPVKGSADLSIPQLASAASVSNPLAMPNDKPAAVAKATAPEVTKPEAFAVVLVAKPVVQASKDGTTTPASDNAASRTMPPEAQQDRPKTIAVIDPTPSVVTPTPASPASSYPDKANAAAFVIQAATFANEANAKRAADKLGAAVKTAGHFYLVQVGPFTSRGQADAALAKVHAAGYSDARVSTSG